MATAEKLGSKEKRGNHEWGEVTTAWMRVMAWRWGAVSGAGCVLEVNWQDLLMHSMWGGKGREAEPEVLRLSSVDNGSILWARADGGRADYEDTARACRDPSGV